MNLNNKKLDENLEWNGVEEDDSDGGLFDREEYDKKEEQMIGNRGSKDRGKAWLKELIKKYRESNPKITDEEFEFGDGKRKRSSVFTDNWHVPCPNLNLNLNLKVPETEEEHVGGHVGGGGGGTDWTIKGCQRRSSLSSLKLKLDRLSDSVSGLTIGDSINKKKIESNSDIKKARLLLESITTKNPTYPHGWIAAARLEEVVGMIDEARQLIRLGCEECPTSEAVWLEACRLTLLSRAVKHVPQSQTLWLMLAKEKGVADGDVPAARSIFDDACAAFPCSEEIWLAAFKLEFENHELERAKILLAKARERVGSERVWMKSAIVERETGNADEERKFLEEGLKRFPFFFKLWLMLGQLEERLGGETEMDHKAKEVYESGIKHCPKCVPLWVSLANLEEKMNGLSKARQVLTLSRNNNPQEPQLWLAAVRAELRHGNNKEAYNLMARAFEECSYDSGVLLAASIEIAPRAAKHRRSMRAVNKCKDNGHIIAAVAKVFWEEGKVDEARSWFNKAVILSPDIGDFWAFYYKMEMQHGTQESRKDVLNRCLAAQPKHGDNWQPIAKAVENAHQPLETILNKVVLALGIGKEANAAPERVVSQHSICQKFTRLST